MSTEGPHTAPSAVAALLDPGAEIHAEGTRVHCSFGTVHGHPAAVYAVETGHIRGAIARPEADRILSISELARMRSMPLIGVNAALAPDLDAGLEGIEACERIARQSLHLAAEIPQLAVITDHVVTAHGYLSAYADLIAMTEGAQGVPTAAHLVEQDEAATFAAARRLARLLPRSTHAFVDRLAFAGDGGDRLLEDGLVERLRGGEGYDARALIRAIADAESFVELDATRGRAVVTGLATIAEQTIGFTASQTLTDDPIDDDAHDKIAEIVGICDRFSIPLIHIIDAKEPATERVDASEIGRGAGATTRKGARLLGARAAMAASVSLIVRRNDGLGLLLSAALRPHHAVIAYPHARFGPEGADTNAQEAMSRGRIKKLIEPKHTVEALVHWVRWSRSERARVTDRFRANDPRGFNLDLGDIVPAE